MNARRPTPSARTLASLIAGLALAAPAADAAAAGFGAVSTNVPPLGTWQINRPIDVDFNAPVDFASVNGNTIRIATTAGVPATGSFELLDADTVRFVPACPSSADLADGGLTPRARYELVVPDASGGGPTVMSTGGASVRQGLAVSFATPDSTDPAVLFVDRASGPPAPVIAPGSADASHVELANGARVDFEPPPFVDPALGAATPAGFRAPLNLYADARSRLAVVVVLDQPIAVGSLALEPDRVRLEYESAPGVWSRVTAALELVANCSGAGASVRVVPQGVLPQGRRVRTVLAAELADLVGDALGAPLVVGTFSTGVATDPGTHAPGDGADGPREEFDGGAASLEDELATFEEPRAAWRGGALTAASFLGTGGPNGDFDWTVGPGAVVLDTTFALITNAQQTAQQQVINGQVEVRNLHVLPGAILSIQGPNPCRIRASGDVLIEGQVLARGNSNPGVATLNTTSIPEPGALGQAGGGRGGTGSHLTTQSTPQGEPGYGPFGQPGLGGGGGESSYHPSPDDNLRRAAGGGGGGLAAQVARPNAPNHGFLVANPGGCPDQTVIGLDAEAGNPGWPTAQGALPPPGPAQGGLPGAGPFADADPANDFWGTLVRANGEIVRGELVAPIAGAGGGAGGNAIHSASFPAVPFDPTGDEKGAGGGGGAGQLVVQALGEIRLGAAGRIDLRGGTGGGGENSVAGGITRIGGGSGGGSAGHLVLESATRIDLSACRSAQQGGIYALGGQGGAGANNAGGSTSNGNPTAPHLDVLPSTGAFAAYPTTGAPPCAMSTAIGYSLNNTVGNPNPSNNGNTLGIVGAGGDGGPGVVQLHVPTLADLLPPTSPGETLWKCVKPPPVGATSDNANTPSAWDRLVPSFGRFSKAQSKWIALGLGTVDPLGGPTDAHEFVFGGTNAQGEVANLSLAPIASGVLGPAPSRPYVAQDARTVVLDGATVADDLWVRTPGLLARCELRLVQGAQTSSFEIGAASHDDASGDLLVTVSGSGMPLAIAQPGDVVELRPRFFRVASDGVPDVLAPSSAIRFEFQATGADAQGDPDPASASAWVADPTGLNGLPGASAFRFLRFRVAFDLAANGAPLSPANPVPSLDFLRVPFRF